MRALALTLVLLAAAAAQNTSPNPTQKTARNLPNSAQHGFLFWDISRHSVNFLLQPVPQTNPLRLAQLRQTFIDLQCQAPNLREQTFADGRNLLCTLPETAPEASATRDTPDPGHESGTILFLAHYEHEGSGQSAIDNWSGALALPFLYHALAATPRQHTFLFTEVDGEAGAKALFNSFTPQQRHAIKGVIALDALGLEPAQFYIDPNDVFATNSGWWWLQRQLFQAAVDQRLPVPASAIPGSWQKIDDTREFRHHGIPSILIHSVAFSARDLPGSARDAASAIDHNTYFNTLVLLAYYAAELDQPWPSSFNTPSRPSSGRHR
jgi:hypothetical protein